jgi:hypothetical protein
VIDQVRGTLRRRPPHDEQKPRPLHENGTSRSWPQPSQ